MPIPGFSGVPQAQVAIQAGGLKEKRKRRKQQEKQFRLKLLLDGLGAGVQAAGVGAGIADSRGRRQLGRDRLTFQQAEAPRERASRERIAAERSKTTSINAALASGNIELLEAILRGGLTGSGTPSGVGGTGSAPGANYDLSSVGDQIKKRKAQETLNRTSGSGRIDDPFVRTMRQQVLTGQTPSVVGAREIGNRFGDVGDDPQQISQAFGFSTPTRIQDALVLAETGGQGLDTNSIRSMSDVDLLRRIAEIASNQPTEIQGGVLQQGRNRIAASRPEFLADIDSKLEPPQPPRLSLPVGGGIGPGAAIGQSFGRANQLTEEERQQLRVLVEFLRGETEVSGGAGPPLGPQQALRALFQQ